MAETEKPAMSRCNLKFKIMDLKKKSFDKLVKKMDVLQEDQKGSLKGGFSSVSSNARAVDADGNGLFCTCNTTSGCGDAGDKEK